MTDTPPTLTYLRSITLKHSGDCTLRGITPDLQIYVDEVYDEEAWMAQNVLTVQGEWVTQMDEDHGKNRDITPIPLPHDAARTQPGWHSRPLNFTGARHRGLRTLERVSDIVRELTIQEKMLLNERLRLNLMPPLILGLAESYVLSEAMLIYPRWMVVCRRVRVAYALPQPATAPDGEPYDYDTRPFYVAHLHDRDRTTEITIAEALDGLSAVTLYRPMDCIVTQGHLFIADGGTPAGQQSDTPRLNQVHVWRVESQPQQA